MNTYQRCPNCRSECLVEEVEGDIYCSCPNDPWCPVGNAIYTPEQWASLREDPEAKGRVCTCGLSGLWCIIHNQYPDLRPSEPK